MNDDLLEVKRDVEGPPGGWRYTVPQTGVLVTAQFYRMLLPRVKSHLMANGFPIPDDLDETVQDGACRETPAAKCGRKKPKPVAGMPLPMLTTFNRFLLTCWSAIRDRRFVEPEEAMRRAEICRSCPLRGPQPEGCTGCYTLIRKVTEALGDNPVKFEVDEDGYVRDCCLSCGCHIPAKSWLLNSTLDRAEGSNRPPYQEGHCWRLES